MFSIVLSRPRNQGQDVKAEHPVTQCIVLRPARCNLAFALHKQLSWVRGEDRDFQALWLWHRDMVTLLAVCRHHSMATARKRGGCASSEQVTMQRAGEQHGAFTGSPRAGLKPLQTDEPRTVQS
jgi:hypothetical protein